MLPKAKKKKKSQLSTKRKGTSNRYLHWLGVAANHQPLHRGNRLPCLFKQSVLHLQQCREYCYPQRCIQTAWERYVEMSKLEACPYGHSSPTVLKVAPIFVASQQSEVRDCSVFPYAVLSLGISLVIVIYDFLSLYLIKSGMNIPGNSSLQERG